MSEFFLILLDWLRSYQDEDLDKELHKMLYSTENDTISGHELSSFLGR